MDSLGRPRDMLLQIRSRYPVALHGVSLSIASASGLQREYLLRLRDLVQQVDPFVVSDHLCWTRGSAHNAHDLLPFPFDDESLQVVVDHVQQVQDTLGRQLVLENISAYLDFPDSGYRETEFLQALVQRTGCGLLLDVNNLYVNAVNYDFDARDYLQEYPLHAVQQMHIAGHTDTGSFLFDTHSAPVADPVWDLLAFVAPRLPDVPVLLEWDADIPPFEELQAEALKAARYLEEV